MVWVEERVEDCSEGDEDDAVRRMGVEERCEGVGEDAWIVWSNAWSCEERLLPKVFRVPLLQDFGTLRFESRDRRHKRGICRDIGLPVR